jgi:hypothetical protein
MTSSSFPRKGGERLESCISSKGTAFVLKLLFASEMISESFCRFRSR